MGIPATLASEHIFKSESIFVSILFSLLPSLTEKNECSQIM